MYNETLKILMEGINDPIKKQILKNQLEYHFKNKNEENQYAIDNTVTIVRRLLSNFNIMDIISVQPISLWNTGGLTIHNEDKEIVKTKSTGLWLNEIESMQAEINHAVAGELDYLITGEILDYMVKYTEHNSINMTFDISNGVNAFVEDVMQVAGFSDAKWIITTPSINAILNTSTQFEENKSDKFKSYPAIQYHGTIDGLEIYTSLHISDTIIVGNNDDKNPPIVYAPETVLMVGDNKDGENRKELLSSSEIFVDLDAVNKQYRKINITFAK